MHQVRVDHMIVVMVHSLIAKFKSEAMHYDVLKVRSSHHSHFAQKLPSGSCVQHHAEPLKLLIVHILHESQDSRENSFGHLGRGRIVCIAFSDSAAILVKVLA